MYTTLISAAELAHNLTDPNWVVIDCRHDLANPEAGATAFKAAHIPMAQFANLDVDLSGAKASPNCQFRGRHPLPERAVFLDTLSKLGVNYNSQVVAYDAQGGMYAARLWWMLRWVGHPAVAVLDGGLQAWQAANQSMSTETIVKAPGDIIDEAPLTRCVNAADVLNSLTDHAFTVIDARAPDRFRGENETMDPVGGHIPGAKNRFFRDNLQADGRFKEAQDLQTEFANLINTPDSSIMQCGSGVTACHNLLAMEIAGLSGAALYPGSWSEWCAAPARPVATGA